MALKYNGIKEAGRSSSEYKQQTFNSIYSQKESDLEKLKEYVIQTLARQNEKMEEKLQKYQLEFMQEIKEIKGVVQVKYENIMEKLKTAASVLSEAVIQTDKKVNQLKLEMNTKILELDYKITNVDNMLQKTENEVTMLKFNLMKSAIRLRGVREFDNTRDLKKVCADAIAVMLKTRPEEILRNMEKVYRVNSLVAKQRHWCRDVVIYFFDKRIRNDILRRSSNVALQVDGKEVAIYKELPFKMLRDRKNFGFLVTELKKQQIAYRWEAPIGLTLWFQGERYRLDTVGKAEEFYSGTLKLDLISQHELQKEEMV